MPPEIYSVFIVRLGPKHIQSHEWVGIGRAYFVKLLGFPWTSGETKGMLVESLLLILLEILATEGWTVYASVSQQNGHKTITETDTVSHVFDTLEIGEEY